MNVSLCIHPALLDPCLLLCCSILVPCRVLPCCLCAFVQVAACASASCTASALRCTAIPANKGAEGAISARERAVNEAALRKPCVFCVLMCLVVCLCVFVFHAHVVQMWYSAPASPAASFVAAPVFVPVCAHGGFQGFVAGGGRCHIRPRHRPWLKPAGRVL